MQYLSIESSRGLRGREGEINLCDDVWKGQAPRPAWPSPHYLSFGNQSIFHLIQNKQLENSVMMWCRLWPLRRNLRVLICVHLETHASDRELALAWSKVIIMCLKCPPRWTLCPPAETWWTYHEPFCRPDLSVPRPLTRTTPQSALLAAHPTAETSSQLIPPVTFGHASSPHP